MLAYLNFTALSSPCIGEQEDQQIASRLRQHSFYTYACTYWGYHVHEVMHEPTIRNRTLTFLKDRSRLAATVQAAWYVGSEYQSGSTWPVRHGVDAIHLCAWFGLEPFIATLLDQKYVAHVDIPEMKRSQTPLMYACVRGHISTALALLQLGVNINHVDCEGNNAISAAILSGYPEVVEHMLMQDTISPPDLNVTIKGRHERTAVMLAVQCGLEPLVTALVRKSDIDVNIKDSNEDTALTLAAAKVSTPIVKTLLEYADINVPNAIGSTALIIAAEGGKGDMVRALLEKNANWKLENHDADTAFSKGIIHGHTGVVKMLLSHGAGSDTVGGSKRTALHIACASGKTKPETIEMLLQEALQMNSLDECRRTPLHDASRIGNFNAAKTLLDSGADQFVEDCHGRTPLLVAWQNGKSDLASLLQESAKQSIPTLESLPGDSSLPLWSMAKLGRLDFIRSTLRKQNVDLQQRDPDTESTALHCAIRTDKLWTQTTGTSGLSTGHHITETLLKGGASTQAVDDHRRTPLHIAAYLGNYEATELLLAYNADPNVRSSWDLTPLSIAQSYKHYFLAVKLLEAGAAVEQGVGQDLQETFCAAVQIGVSTVAEILLGHGVDLGGRNAQGQMAIELARASGDNALLAWLRKLLYN